MPTQADLEAALLTAQQVGPGFQQQLGGTGGISENSLNNVCAAVGGGAKPSATATRVFEANPGTANLIDVTEELLQFTVPQAKAQLNQFAQVVNACPSSTVTIHLSGVGDLTIQIGIAVESFTAIGDQTAAIRVTADITNLGEIVTGDIVAVRHGGTVILVVNVSVPLRSNLTSSVAQAAYAGVAARW